jgi:hypothetical protein
MHAPILIRRKRPARADQSLKGDVSTLREETQPEGAAALPMEKSPTRSAETAMAHGGEPPAQRRACVSGRAVVVRGSYRVVVRLLAYGSTARASNRTAFGPYSDVSTKVTVSTPACSSSPSSCLACGNSISLTNTCAALRNARLLPTWRHSSSTWRLSLA